MPSKLLFCNGPVGFGWYILIPYTSFFILNFEKGKCECEIFREMGYF